VPFSLTVDPIKCDAYGYCAELLPTLVQLDEWGYPITACGPIPDVLVQLAHSAARQCPRQAFLVERMVEAAK
jgi:ferredoxin